MDEIIALRAFRDNYIWLIRQGKNTVVVDPGDAKPVIEVLAEKALKLTAILITHHHWDHTGGMVELHERFKAPIYGPANDPLEHCDVRLKEHDEVVLPEINTRLRVLDIPGHTRGHIAYVNENICFCGDTLFSIGCGRVFEGTHEQMLASLNKLKNLNDDVAVYPAHEYTKQNIRFAMTVTPNNKELQSYLEDCETKLAQNQPTLPSTMAIEKALNPFLKSDEPGMQKAVSDLCRQPLTDSLSTFSMLRDLKDSF